MITIITITIIIVTIIVTIIATTTYFIICGKIHSFLKEISPVGTHEGKMPTFQKCPLIH